MGPLAGHGPDEALCAGELPPDEVARLAGFRHRLGRRPPLPQARFKDIQRPELPPRNHYHHFVEACLGGENTESHFAQTGPMTEAVLLGTVAIRVPGQKLAWDQPGMKFKSYPEANHYLKRI